jgi:hypothetical protein
MKKPVTGKSTKQIMEDVFQWLFIKGRLWGWYSPHFPCIGGYNDLL